MVIWSEESKGMFCVSLYIPDEYAFPPFLSPHAGGVIDVGETICYVGVSLCTREYICASVGGRKMKSMQ